MAPTGAERGRWRGGDRRSCPRTARDIGLLAGVGRETSTVRSVSVPIGVQPRVRCLVGPACTFWPDKIAQLIVWNVNTVDEKRRCFPISPPVVRFGSLHTVGSASFFPDGPLRRESSPPNAENQTCKTTIGRQLASHILRKYQLSTLALFVDWLRQNLKVRTGRNTGRGSQWAGSPTR